MSYNGVLLDKHNARDAMEVLLGRDLSGGDDDEE